MYIFIHIYEKQTKKVPSSIEIFFPWRANNNKKKKLTNVTNKQKKLLCQFPPFKRGKEFKVY